MSKKKPPFPTSFPLTPQRLQILVQLTDHGVKSAGLQAFNPEMQDFVGTLGTIVEQANAAQAPDGPQAPPAPGAPAAPPATPAAPVRPPRPPRKK